jgi:hypothetical protein
LSEQVSICDEYVVHASLPRSAASVLSAGAENPHPTSAMNNTLRMAKQYASTMPSRSALNR